MSNRRICGLRGGWLAILVGTVGYGCTDTDASGASGPAAVGGHAAGASSAGADAVAGSSAGGNGAAGGSATGGTGGLAAGASGGGVASASRVFFDDFESGTTAAWQSEDDRNRCPVVDVSSDGHAPHAGSKMVECNWDGTVEWNDARSYEALQVVFDTSSETLFRGWLRIQPDMDVAPNSTGPKILRLTSQANGSIGVDQLVSNPDMHQNGRLTFSGVIGDLGTIPTFWGGEDATDDWQWHELEIYVRKGDPGTIRFWFDQQLMSEYEGVTSSDAANRWNTFMMSSNWSGDASCCMHDELNHINWDDIEIFSDTPSGTPAAGTMADRTIAVP